MADIILKKGREDRVLSGHPWIYHGEVLKNDGHFADGDIVVVKNYKGKFLGQGMINSSSQIILRLLTRRTEVINNSFFRDRIKKAIEYRDAIVKDTNAKRMVFSEGDFLPGLIIDYYNGCIVIQTLTLGMDKRKEIIIETLKEMCNPAMIYERNDIPVRELEGMSQKKGLLYGNAEMETVCNINGVSFVVSIAEGQKTGTYLDQRENYNTLRTFVRDKTVLDCFCYTGGFGISAAFFGAKHVLGIDISDTAIGIAKRNAEINNLGNICSWDVGNAFTVLRDKTRKRECYDMVILDPPPFTKARDSVPSAIRGYKEINLRAIRLVSPGGYLLTCCCSYHITRELFMDVIRESKRDAKRELRLVEYRTQSKDHPILPAVPETEYLKCFILQVL